MAASTYGHTLVNCFIFVCIVYLREYLSIIFFAYLMYTLLINTEKVHQCTFGSSQSMEPYFTKVANAIVK